MKYNFDQIIKRKGTDCTQWDFVYDRFGQKDLTPFTISDSDFNTAPAITKALENRLKHQIFGYTRWNNSTFAPAIKKWFKTEFTTDIEIEDIVYGPTVMYMIKTVLSMLGQQGEVKPTVIVNNPSYDGFTALLAGLEYPQKYWHIGKDNGIDLRAFEKLCQQKETKVFLFCNPHNPTGIVFKAETIKEILKICQQNDIFIISDEIHMDFVYQPNVHIPISKYAAEYKMDQKIALITSASKTFNTAGLICAYMILPNQALQQRYLHILRKIDCLSSASTLGLIATVAAYDHGKIWLDQMKEYLQKTHTIIEKYIIDNELPLTFIQPEATYFIWLDIEKFGTSEQEIQKMLLAEKVAIMGGSTYLHSSGNYLRLNIAAPHAKIIIGLDAIRAVYLKLI
ncbi:MAG: MalY/PatB family protein [Culicoidibacterales bacterium]